MKSKQVFFLIVAVIVFITSCEDQLVSPDFDVTATVTKTQKYNETGTEMLDVYQVSFVFTGNAKNIVFYSGENGAEYRNRNRAYGMVIPHVQFSAAYAGDFPNSLRVLASNNFKPEYEYFQGRENRTLYTKAGVEAATWIDINNRFTLPGNQLTAGIHKSGEAVFSEFHHNLPLFIAFRFDADRASDPSLSIGQWTFSQFSIRNVFDDGTSAFYVNNVLDRNWKTVDLANPTTVTVSGNRIVLNGNQYSVTKTDGEGNEVEEIFQTTTVKTMLISRPFYPSQVETDKGSAIKSVEENLFEYTHIYIDPQVESVNAVFVATNSLYGKTIQEVKQMNIVFNQENQ